MFGNALNSLNIHRSSRRCVQQRKLPDALLRDCLAISDRVALSDEQHRQNVFDKKALGGERPGKALCNVIHNSPFRVGVATNTIAGRGAVLQFRAPEGLPA